MFSKEIVVRCESGLHNRQATYFVQKANEFDASIWVESGNRNLRSDKSLYTAALIGSRADSRAVKRRSVDKLDRSFLASGQKHDRCKENH